MNTIPIAQKKEFHEESTNKGRFNIEPLYPGYGLTLGNALRRVLLSSLEGVAITLIRLKGAEHEFSTIEGIKEDVVDIILNLKQVRFEAAGEFEEPIKLELKVKGNKEAKAGDFKKTAGVKIANPDLVLATLTDTKAEFDLEVWIERGRGYLPTESVETKEKEAGVIAIDAIFSPVKKVAIDTENVRVGEMTNWDKLILDLETDGTMDPEDALKKAAQILVDQFNFFLESKKVEKKKPADTLQSGGQAAGKDEDKKTAITEDTDPDVHRGTEDTEDKKSEKEDEEEEKPKKRGRPKKTEE